METHALNHMETVTLLKEEYEQMKRELRALRKSKLYERLLEFEQNIAKGKKLTRSDLGI